jgi:hypothetical protein
MFRVFNKHHGLNYLNLDDQRANAYGKEYSMRMHYPLVEYPKNTLGFKTYLLKLVGILHNHIRRPIPLIKHHGFTLLEGYCSCSKLHNTFVIPLIWFPKNTLGH